MSSSDKGKMMDDKHRALDAMDFKRVNDEVWSSAAGVDTHKMLYAIYNDVQELKHKVGRMEEMFMVWTSTKGFITTLKWISRLLIGIAVISGVIAGMWYSFKKAVTGL